MLEAFEKAAGNGFKIDVIVWKLGRVCLRRVSGMSHALK